MKEKINRYFNDMEFRYTVYLNRLHIMNFRKILSLEEDRISILFSEGRILFRGNGFILDKLMDQEVLIRGVVLGVDVYEE